MTKRRKRTARKLALPLLAIGLMTLMMSLGSGHSSSERAPGAKQAAQLYRL